MKSITLTKPLPAIEIRSGEEGAQQFGKCRPLEAGSVVEICGNGFSARTVQVRSGGCRYYMVLASIDDGVHRGRMNRI